MVMNEEDKLLLSMLALEVQEDMENLIGVADILTIPKEDTLQGQDPENEGTEVPVIEELDQSAEESSRPKCRFAC